ncbi:hypothetical protein ACHWQZ_G008233 [Mnemiopsis leidyi]
MLALLLLLPHIASSSVQLYDPDNIRLQCYRCDGALYEAECQSTVTCLLDQVCYSRSYQHIEDGEARRYLVDKGCTWNTTQQQICESYMRPCVKYVCGSSFCNYLTNSSNKADIGAEIYFLIGIMFTLV